MITHHIDEDGQSGNFADDHGRMICHWNWDAELFVLRVRVGQTERPVDLSSFDIDRLTEDELIQRLIEIAQSTGDDLGANFGE